MKREPKTIQVAVPGWAITAWIWSPLFIIGYIAGYLWCLLGHIAGYLWCLL